MATKDLNNWIMFYEIKKLSLLGFSNKRIARYLVIDRRTLANYLKMGDEDFENHLTGFENRSKILGPYEDFVKQKLQDYPDTSSAQMFDWLKENHTDLPKITSRTVYNFVIYVHQKYNLPLEKHQRDYFPVEELPYGKQAQVDFGVYNMRTTEGKRKKIYFFSMVLSRSRMKYVQFSKDPFTAEAVCKCHEAAFAFFGGIVEQVAYDQDRTMMVDENLGKLILTSAFRQYVKTRGLSFTSVVNQTLTAKAK